ncbi:type IV secretory system conjugative DNA transfer family protein [Rhizobium sp. RU36D]|uniref:type IV secretory system conjugative DNA transfer family protein n=1 Tax=Rhizobium sp. RU36D TaxID=1907415 RepID=UPI0009D828E4|nr:type IV secretory system conjugative DNA transfer family protein [Rhizobium sp. RU36D]SMC78022.1 Type IV secretory pathway, VirD4 component, TraG/TraD family ATPase [Rhizobium sp. RU36D]
MSIPVRPKSGPVNGNTLLAALCASAAWQFWPSESGGSMAMAGLCSAMAIPTAFKGLRLGWKDYRLRRDLVKTAQASTDHGTGREAEWAELVARHMHDPASGNFLGMYAGKYPVFSPPKTPFSLIEMPPGVGKTIFLVMQSVLHQARLGKSLFIPDVKTELAPMMVPALRAMGLDVWCINPAKAHLDICGAVELNLYQPVIDACHDKGEFRKDTIKLGLDLADLHLPEPKDGDTKNLFFRNGQRRCISIAILSNALMSPALCTPADVFALLNDPKKFRERLIKLRHEAVRMFPNDPIAEFLQTEAANLLDKFENNAEHAASFMEGATQPLISFNQGGRMAGYGRTATANIAEIRKRQIIVFVMSPLSHARDFAPVVSLLNHTLLEVAKRDPAGHPIHIVGEEALNYRFADIVSDMETMRGLKISADFYIQSFNGLIKKYGREAAAAIEAYSDVKVYAGINSFDRARHISDMLAEATIKRQDYSYQADVKDIGVSSREQGRRLMTPDEILAMPRNRAWVFTRGLRPLRLTMIDYGRIAPFRDEVADNPLEGSKLYGDAVFTIRYPDKGTDGKPVIEGVRYRVRRARKARRFVAPVRLRHLLWVPPVLALWTIGPLDVPLPHLRYAYEYTGPYSHPYYRRCTYVGPHSRTIIPERGECPVVLLFSKP